VPEEAVKKHPHAKNAESFWLTPDATADINCINCHDSDAWVHSPYVNAVKDKEGRSHLPNTWEMGWPHKYIILGQGFGFGKWNTCYSIPSESIGSCVSCNGIRSIAD